MEDKIDRCSPTVRNPTEPTPTRPSRLNGLSKAIALVLACVVFFHRYCLPVFLSFNTENLGRHRNNDIVPLRNDYELFSSTRTPSSPYNTPRPQYTPCNHTDRTMQIATEFNVTNEFHFRDTSPPQDARGWIVVHRGSDAQVADIEVSITIDYTSPSLPVVSSGFDPRTGTMSLSYTSTECVQVSIDISLRPDTRKRLRKLDMVTEMLNLRLAFSLSWVVDNLDLHSAQGQVDYGGSFTAEEPLITHNVSVSSGKGEISGWFILDANLHLRNEVGSISVILLPRTYSEVPMVLESINASTKSGNIDIQMWMEQPEVWPMEPFTHTTQMRSETGSIWASVPLGTLTNYTSETGNIVAIMVPFGAASEDASKEIHVESKHGDRVYVNVVNTMWDSLKDGRFNPLLRLRSRHKANNGTLIVKYASGWRGELEGLVNKGTLDFDGSHLGDVEKGENWVKATVGEGMSFMESWLDEGDLDIKVGMGRW